MQSAADTTGDPAQGCTHAHGHGHSHGHDRSHGDGGDGGDGVAAAAAPAAAPALPAAAAAAEDAAASALASAPGPSPAAGPPLPKFHNARHVKYFLANLRSLPEPYAAADSNRMTLVFFCVSALDVMGALHGPGAVLSAEEVARVVDWIYANQVVAGPGGKFRSHAGFIGGTFMGTSFASTTEAGDTPSGSMASVHNFAHIAMTYTALATLATLGDDFSRVQRDDVLFAVGKLQREDGMFMSTVAGSEADMRFVYCASAICKMLGDFSTIDKERSVAYIARSQTYDGSFGLVQNQEAHGGSTFCAVASLGLMGCLDRIPRVDDLVQWCIARQVGGFQGRCNKDPDTCYSFWVGGTLKVLGRFDLVDTPSNAMFHASCQFMYGGFSKFPSIYPDLLHSFFSVCFLSMKGLPGFGPIEPLLCISDRADQAAPWAHQSSSGGGGGGGGGTQQQQST